MGPHASSRGGQSEPLDSRNQVWRASWQLYSHDRILWTSAGSDAVWEIERSRCLGESERLRLNGRIGELGRTRMGLLEGAPARRQSLRHRVTTGAVVLRQPFGGFGKSAFGPGMKAG